MSSFTSSRVGTAEVSRRAWAPEGMDEEGWSGPVGVGRQLTGTAVEVCGLSVAAIVGASGGVVAVTVDATAARVTIG